MKKIFTAAIALLFIGTLQAQHFCGTTIESQKIGLDRLVENRANASHNSGTAGQRDVDYYVPVKFHIVGKNDGTQFITEAAVLDMLCTLNNAYAPFDIQFYLKMPFNYIKNDALYNDAGGTGGVFQIGQNKVNDALNIFITGTFPQSGLQGYYQPGQPLTLFDYIVIKKSAVYGSTAPHEVGHFFSLAHPFFGWENPQNIGWNEASHGNPVETNAPSIGFQTPVANEKADQSNCSTAADMICDTPPDYLFAFSPGQSGCNSWNGGAMDPDGTVVDPMETNMMSYFPQCSDYVFTADQREAIVLDLESPARNYVRPGYTPSTAEITEAANLITPINDEITPGYNAVNFNWATVPGAQYYLLEIDIFPTFTTIPSRYIVQGNFKTVEDIFNANTTYKWRVRPFGEYVTCGTPFSSTGSFKTGTTVNVNEIEAVNGWTVRPNPVTSSESLTIELDAAQSFDAEINLYNTAGQLMKTVGSRNFTAGINNVQLSAADLSPGLYIVVINSSEGILNKKVVVTK